MIAIIDYGAGNVASIRNMLKRLGQDSVLTSDPAVLEDAEKLILPGVGHFDYGMEKLEQSGIVPLLNRRVLEKKTPILGICLGVQLFTRRSDEGVRPGLGWIDAETVAFDRKRLKPTDRVPHMGWCHVHKGPVASPLVQDLADDARFYFVHSYFVEPQDESVIAARTDYGQKFVSMIARKNLFATQFHPEKSQAVGLKLLGNFASL